MYVVYCLCLKIARKEKPRSGCCGAILLEGVNPSGSEDDVAFLLLVAKIEFDLNRHVHDVAEVVGAGTGDDHGVRH